MSRTTEGGGEMKQIFAASAEVRKKYPRHGRHMGRVEGHTSTDYFHFYCPDCPDDGTDAIYLNVELVEVAKWPKAGVIIKLGVHCDKCKFTDLIKIGLN